MPVSSSQPRHRRVAIAVRSWAAEESVFVWNWAKKYFIETGESRDWLYIVHVNTPGKTKENWKAAGPLIPELDRALQQYSYDIVELTSDTASHSLVQWVEKESIDVLIVSMGRNKSRLNPISSRTTDFITAHSTCATLVIHPQNTLADLTRCHQDAGRSEEQQQVIDDKRRVAVADESEDGLTRLSEWAASYCSRPDDLEFKLLVNSKSMLARVQLGIRPANRRRSVSQGPVGPSDPAQPRQAFNEAPEASPAVDESIETTQLRGKPAQVIKGFVTSKNIDLLIVPVLSTPAFKRLDPRNMRDVKPSKSKSVYHKAHCTCLCVPLHLLRRNDGSVPAPSDGLLFSEDEGEDEEGRLIRSPRSRGPASPRALTMHHVDPLPSGLVPLTFDPSSTQTPPPPTFRSLPTNGSLPFTAHAQSPSTPGPSALTVPASPPTRAGSLSADSPVRMDDASRSLIERADKERGLLSSLRHRLNSIGRKKGDTASSSGPNTQRTPQASMQTFSHSAEVDAVQSGLADLHATLLASDTPDRATIVTRALALIPALSTDNAELRVRVQVMEARIEAATAALTGYGVECAHDTLANTGVLSPLGAPDVKDNEGTGRIAEDVDEEFEEALGPPV